MTALLLLCLLVAAVYGASVWWRGTMSSAGEILAADKAWLRSWYGAPSEELFAAARRVPSPEPEAPHPPPAGDSKVAGGPRRTRNVHAPCWLCGQPNTPEHHH